MEYLWTSHLTMLDQGASTSLSNYNTSFGGDRLLSPCNVYFQFIICQTLTEDSNLRLFK
jgi:hypothetical protein